MKKYIYIALMLLLVAACMVTGCSKEEAAKEEKKIAYLYMPSLEGMMEEEAKGKLDEMGFYNYLVEYEESSAVEVGRVIRQSIQEHTTVGTDYEIKVWICSKEGR